MLELVHTVSGAGPPSNLDDEALQWVVRLTSGETGEDDHQAFRAWRDQSVEHALALARARQLWAGVGKAAPSAVRARTKRTRRWATGLAAAASLATSVFLGDAYLSDWRYDHATAAGEHRTVVLPDGSRMILSGDTAANVAYRNGVRAVDLARGEALFTVRHDEAHPFVVRADGHSIRDLGTVFDVALNDTGVGVTVAEGVVEVSSDEKRTPVRPGQQVQLTSTGTGPVYPVDASATIAWARGRLIVEDRPLREIIAALKPHFSGRIVLLDSAAGQKRMSAVIDLRRADDWLRGLERDRSVRLFEVGGTMILA